MGDLHKQMQKWERRRSRGKWSFVFRFGVLGMGMSWGLMMAIFGAVFIEGGSALPLLFAVSIPVGALFGLGTP